MHVLCISHRCQGQQIEEIVKHCTRRARLAGLLLLQVCISLYRSVYRSISISPSLYLNM